MSLITDLQVRVLSKCTLMVDLALSLEDYKDRIIYGFSTGALRKEVSDCIEDNASPVLARLAMLKYLQEHEYRTFAMLCPIITSEMKYVEELIDAVNPAVCEHIWAEPINVRGKSLSLTRDKLLNCGLHDEASEMENVIGNSKAWGEYCIALFEKIRDKMISINQLKKLRFNQYRRNQPVDFVDYFYQHIHEGAVPLFKKRK